MEPPLQPQTVIIKPEPEHLPAEHQHEDIEEDGKRVVLQRGPVRPVAQYAVPTGEQQGQQEGEAEHEIADLQPAMNAVVAARLGRIGGYGRLFLSPFHGRITYDYRLTRGYRGT